MKLFKKLALFITAISLFPISGIDARNPEDTKSKGITRKHPRVEDIQARRALIAKQRAEKTAQIQERRVQLAKQRAARRTQIQELRKLRAANAHKQTKSTAKAPAPKPTIARQNQSRKIVVRQKQPSVVQSKVTQAPKQNADIQAKRVLIAKQRAEKTAQIENARKIQAANAKTQTKSTAKAPAPKTTVDRQNQHRKVVVKKQPSVVQPKVTQAPKKNAAHLSDFEKQVLRDVNKKNGSRVEQEALRLLMKSKGQPVRQNSSFSDIDANATYLLTPALLPQEFQDAFREEFLTHNIPYHPHHQYSFPGSEIKMRGEMLEKLDALGLAYPYAARYRSAFRKM